MLYRPIKSAAHSRFFEHAYYDQISEGLEQRDPPLILVKIGFWQAVTYGKYRYGSIRKGECGRWHMVSIDGGTPSQMGVFVE